MFTYDNIGQKIKSLATGTFVVEAIAAIIAGIYLITSSENMVLIGFLVIFAGPLVAWVLSWLLYGFGQLIENSDIIAEESKRKNDKHDKLVAQNNERKQKQKAQQQYAHVREVIENPGIHENDFIDIICPHCSETLSYPKGQLENNSALICPLCGEPISFT